MKFKYFLFIVFFINVVLFCTIFSFGQKTITPELIKELESQIISNPQKVINTLYSYEKQVKKGKFPDSLAIWFYHTMADAYYYKQNFRKAIKYYDKELNLLIKNSTDKNKLVRVYYNLGSISFNTSNYYKSSSYYEKALKIALNLKDNFLLLQIYKALSKSYEKQAKFKKAYNAFKKYSYYKDKVYKIKSTEKIALLKDKLTQEQRQKIKKEKELKQKKEELLKTKTKLTETEAINKLLEKDAIIKKQQINRLRLEKELKEQQIKIKEAEARRKAEKIKAQRRIIMLISALVLLIIVFSAFVLFLFARLKKTHKLVLKQKSKIEIQNKKIRDSINYAKQIQQALLPWQETIAQHFPENFIFFKPRDIVSGDFYWLAQRDKYTYLAAVDCTGHGVPGAFMSMLGIAFLTDIVNLGETPPTPLEILEKLREYIFLALKDKDDGMDMALIRYDKTTNEILFSGANNSLILISNDGLIEYKPTKSPIGKYIKPKPFKQEKVSFSGNTMLYMFSDGYIDQFGGNDGSKFMKKRFKKLLQSIWKLPMEVQKTTLEENLEQWISQPDKKYQQTDDILIIGIRLKT